MRWIAQNHTANLMWHINPYMVFFTQQDTRVRERLALRDNRELSWQDPESLPNIARTRFSGRSAPSNSSSVECFKSAVCQCPSPPHLPGTSSLMRMLTDPDTPPPPFFTLYLCTHKSGKRKLSACATSKSPVSSLRAILTVIPLSRLDHKPVLRALKSAADTEPKKTFKAWIRPWQLGGGYSSLYNKMVISQSIFL